MEFSKIKFCFLLGFKFRGYLKIETMLNGERFESVRVIPVCDPDDIDTPSILRLIRHDTTLKRKIQTKGCCLFSSKKKKTRTEGRRCHVRTMMNTDTGEDQT